MSYEILIGIGSFIVMMITVVTPIMKLNTSITKLNDTLHNAMQKIDDVKKMTDAQELRLQASEQKIVKIETDIEDHERRLTKLEK